jgi:hypothetical protein
MMHLRFEFRNFKGVIVVVSPAANAEPAWQGEGKKVIIRQRESICRLIGPEETGSCLKTEYRLRRRNTEASEV